MKKFEVFNIIFYMMITIILYTVVMLAIYMISYSLIINGLEWRNDLKRYALIPTCVILQSAVLFLADVRFFHSGFRVHEKFGDHFAIIIVFMWVLLVVSGVAASVLSNIERNFFSAEMETSVGFSWPLMMLIWPQFYVISVVFPFVIEGALGRKLIKQ